MFCLVVILNIFKLKLLHVLSPIENTVLDGALELVFVTIVTMQFQIQYVIILIVHF